jgi:uncharacterized protein
LRFVAVADGEKVSLVADPARRLPGRGAHVHRDPACVALAERRSAFGRALRLTGVFDPGPLVDHVTLGTTDGGVHPTPDYAR